MRTRHQRAAVSPERRAKSRALSSRLDDADGESDHARKRPGLPVGFLVSGAAQHRNRWPKTGDGNVARSSAAFSAARPTAKLSRCATQCPHRGDFTLSYGRFDGKAVECSYHGWRFEACSGRCIEIPSRTDQDKFQDRTHFRRPLRVRRARRLRLGLHARKGTGAHRSPRQFQWRHD